MSSEDRRKDRSTNGSEDLSEELSEDSSGESSEDRRKDKHKDSGGGRSNKSASYNTRPLDRKKVGTKVEKRVSVQTTPSRKQWNTY